MKDFLKNYISSEEWLIKEVGWDRQFQGVNETIFSLGNGYIGTRGVLEEIPYDAYPGTYIAGIYDRTGAFVPELVNMPNPVDFKIIVDGEKLDVIAMDILKHLRILDMKKGTLFRKTTFLNAKKNGFDYQSLRFFSMYDFHLGVMRICFTSLDEPKDITVQTTIDTGITNKGILMEGRKRHFQVVETSKKNNINFLLIKTFESKISVGYASSLRIFDGKREYDTSERMISIRAKRQESLVFTKFFVIYTSREVKEKKIKRYCLSQLQDSMKKGFYKIFNLHKKAWQKRWDISNIFIEPDKELERALRFNIYHLLIAGNPVNTDVSIPARAITGEAYRGHIFWDAEIFILPFFIYTEPNIAKSMLSYRYNCLGQAGILAKNRGYKGALFPWESADIGSEVTPQWHKDLDGRIIRIKTGELEHHITGDIAYGVYNYYMMTNDTGFMLKKGYEIIFETARFWASRVEYNRKKGLYYIRHVIGPDEFHEDVDNNSYTNYLAKWNLLYACRVFRKNSTGLSRDFKNLVKKIGLSEKEIDRWEDIAKGIYIPVSKNGIIEEFSGYFKKRYIRICQLDRNFMPMIPTRIPLKKISITQFIKQPDVIMLFHLFPWDFSQKQITNNFKFYDKRCLHKSSLSPAISSVIACRVGEYYKSYHYFLFSLYTDLKNLHGNTSEGIHAASLGGIWQAVVNGFCGIKMEDEILSLNPHLPDKIHSVKLKIRYREFILSIYLKQDKIEIVPFSSKGDGLKLKIFGALKELCPHKRYSFKKEECYA